MSGPTMNRLKECVSYWWRLATQSKDLFDNIAWVLTVIMWPVSAVGLAVAEPALKIILLGIACLLSLRTIVWLPFKEHTFKEGELTRLKAESQIELNQLKAEVAGRLIIHSAYYFHGEKSEDVTHAIRERIVEGFKVEKVSNDLAKVDPKPYSVKTLKIDYSFQQKRETVNIQEGHDFVLPRVPSLGTRGFGRFEVI